MWRLYLLGSFRLERDGEPIALSTRKVEALLAYLALYPGAHSREKIRALFWGDSSDAAAGRSLRVALTWLRRGIGKDGIISDRETLGLNPAFLLWVDARAVLEFQIEGESPDTAYVDNLQAIVESNRGELLARWYDEWLTAPRTQLSARLQNLGHHLIEIYRTRGEYARAITAAQRALALDAADEIAHQHLMFSYLALGDRTAALQQYEECKHALHIELCVEPSEETNRLHDTIREKASGSSRAARLTNLPHPLTSFIGRSREVTDLTRWLAEEKRPLITLLGPGGSGKTRLAIETASRLVSTFSDGVWWVDLAPLNDPALVLPTIARVLGVIDQGGQPLLAALTDAVRFKQLLLVLDNCEHVLDECAQVGHAMLAQAKGLEILTTTREPLGIPGEITYTVPTLGVPDTSTMSAAALLMSFEGVRLFVERARVLKPDFELTEQNALAVTQICMQLDGIPLALELAAARLNVLSAEQIALRLHDRFQLLTNQQRQVLPRQQTLRALIDWSHDLLNDPERVLFRRLAIFAGGWTLEAAEEIIGDDTLPRAQVLDGLSSLIRKSLVAVDESADEIKYRFLETIHAYAREKLLQVSSEHATLSARHYDYFSKFAVTLQEEIRKREQLTWLGRADREQDNFRAALGWAFEHDRVHGGAQMIALATSLWEFWLMRGQYSEGEKWLRRALVELPASNDLEHARALTGLGTMAWGKGDVVQAIECHRSALELYRTLDDPDGIVLSLDSLMAQTIVQGEFAATRELYLQAEPYLDRVTIPRLRAWVYLNLSAVALASGDLAQAEEWNHRILEIAQESQDVYTLGTVLHNVGHTSYIQKNYTRALKEFEQAQTALEKVGDPRNLAVNEYMRALVLMELEEYAAADAAARSSFELSWRAMAQLDVASSLEVLAVIRTAQARTAASTQGIFELAAALCGAAETLRCKNRVAPLQNAPEPYEKMVNSLRAQLGDTALEQAWEQGRALTLSELPQFVRTLSI